MPSTWLDTCRAFAACHGVSERVVDELSSFSSPWPRGGEVTTEAHFDGDFAALEAASPLPSVGRVGDALRDVDEAQARMFGRRLAAVDGRLGSMRGAEARLLRVGLRRRATAMVADARPGTALRLRALVDFYYSLASLLVDRQRGLPAAPLVALLDGLRWRRVGEGVQHARLQGRSEQFGSLHANLLLVDPRRAPLRVVDRRERVGRGLTLVEDVREAGALAAVSGGFFLYSEADIDPPSARYDPVGLLVSDGRLVAPPVFRRGALLVDSSGDVHLGPLGLAELRAHVGARELELGRAVTRAQAVVGPDEPSLAIVGHRVVAAGASLPVPLNGFVVPGTGAPSDVVIWELPPAWRQAVAGGPTLLRAGRPALDYRAEDFWGSAPPVTFSQDETGDRNLLPRLAVGQRPDGQLIFAAVDGRDFERALGITLGGLARLLAVLGCRDAVNLDGGSSKRMVVGDAAVDLASTEVQGAGQGSAPVRPVHTAVLIGCS